MSFKALIGLVLLALTGLACAQQAAPSVSDWVLLFEEVRQHALFKPLTIAYGQAPAAEVGYSPVGVIPREGLDCMIVISEGENPKMARIMGLTSTPANAHAFLLAIAAHEFGHCVRMHSQHLSLSLWQRVLATKVGSPERHALERTISIEEAYADAYAFAYIHDAHRPLFDQVLDMMGKLRRSTTAANPYYQVEPLYAQLEHRGLNTTLSLPMQVEAAIAQSDFGIE